MITLIKNSFLLLLFIALLSISCSKGHQDTQSSQAGIDVAKTATKAKEALNFCQSNSYNTDFCILIDMSVHSGKKRFVVWDFNKQKVMHEFLVSHGCGENTWGRDQSKENPTFSNVPDSHLSSLGKYKIGERGYSQWGINIKYLMHGLEPTNNNALKRVIVFHSWENVSDQETFPHGTPEGWGCPAVSIDAFQTIDPILKASQKPVLMWIYI